MKRIFCVLAVLLCVFSNSLRVFAAAGPDTWAGNNTANLGDGAANWTGTNDPPTSGDSLIFDAAGSSGTSLTDTLSSLSINGITFNAGAPAYTIAGSGGNTFTLTGAIANNSSNNETLGMDIGGSTILNNGSGSGEAILTGPVTSSVSSIEENSAGSTSLLIKGGITVNSGGTTLTTDSSSTLGLMVVSIGDVTGTGNLTLNNNSINDGWITIESVVNNTGTITNSGTGGLADLNGGIGSNVTGIIQDSASSILSIEDLALNAGGTTFTDTGGAQIFVTSNVTGAADLILNNNSSTADAIVFNDHINNAGTIINSGTGSGETLISATVGSNVTGITENSSGGSALLISGPLTTAGTTLTDTAGQLTLTGGVSGAGNLTLNNNSTTANGITLSTTSVNNTGSITNSGSSTGSTLISAVIGPAVTSVIQNSTTSGLILSGINTYTGNTTVSAGILNIQNAHALGSGAGTTSVTSGADLQIQGGITTAAEALTLNGTGISSSGALENVSGTNIYAGLVTLGSSTLINSDAGTLTLSNVGTITGATFGLTVGGPGNTVIDSIIGTTSGTLTKSGSGTLSLAGNNTYTGTTTVSAGTLQAGVAGSAFGNGSAVTVGPSGTLDLNGNSETIGTLAGAGTVTDSSLTAVTLTTGNISNTTFSGTIQDGTGVTSLTKQGTGTFTLSGVNTYSGTSTINAGTLAVGNANALGTGAVTNNATLSIGTTSLSLGGVYTQNPGSSLALTANSSSSFGSITSTGHTAVVDAGSTVNVTVGGYIPKNTTFDIINTGGSGIGSAPSTVTSTSPFVSFTDSILNGDLILTVSTSGNFASFANNPNALAVGTDLDNITNPSSDMSNVLNTLESLSSSQITAALNTMGPEMDGGVIQNTTASLNNLISATLDRIQDAMNQGKFAGSGASSGDESILNGLWAKQYGSYETQGTREGIQGYDAWNTGTAVGIDHLFDNLTLGISGGYSYGQVNADANNGSTGINSAQGTVYAGYQDPNHPYFIDAAGFLAENWYSGQRDINLVAINRTADADYDGQQFGTYLEGGYKFDLGHNVELTPLSSLQWTHLSFNRYTESNAGSLDLMVNRQSYNILESGLGASISTEEEYNWGILTPEFHVKWLYDFIDDDMVVTSAYTGGGGSFTSIGASPAKDGVNLGGKLSLDFKKDISLIAGLDTQIKDGFFGISGTATVRYKF